MSILSREDIQGGGLLSREEAEAML